MWIQVLNTEECTQKGRGLNIGKSPLPPTSPGGGGISADVIWRKKYEKEKRKGRKYKR
jgi:hypothetical protein